MLAIFFHLNGDQPGKKEVFTNLPISIGRSSTNDLILDKDNRKASSKHAEIVFDGSHFILKDLDSTNGTFINGEQITEASLVAKDIIEFGLGGPKFSFEIAMPETLPQTVSETPAPMLPLAQPNYNAAYTDDRKEFGRTTVQFMLTQAVNQNSRRWQVTVLVLLLISGGVLTIFFYQQRYGQAQPMPVPSTTIKNTNEKLSFSDIAARNQRSIVLVYTRYELYDQNGKMVEEGISNGSGFVANSAGEIVTNRHVIHPWEFNNDKEKLTKQKLTGKIKQIGIFFADDLLDPKHLQPVKDYELSDEADVAILHINPAKDLKAAQSINSDMNSLHQGDEIVVLAFPLGTDLNQLTGDKRAKSSLTRGVISKIPDNKKQIQLDVAAYEGSSGGAIFNNAGEIIGLLTSGPNDTLNFGTPIRYATKFLQSQP